MQIDFQTAYTVAYFFLVPAPPDGILNKTEIKYISGAHVVIY